MAKGLEERLYHSANTKEVYLDECTLISRLKGIYDPDKNNGDSAEQPKIMKNAEAGVANKWQSNDDLPQRRHVIHRVFDVLKSMGPQDTSNNK